MWQMEEKGNEITGDQSNLAQENDLGGTKHPGLSLVD
jgi:hypothetical protein